MNRLIATSTLSLALAALPLATFAADALPSPTATPVAVAKLSAAVQAQHLSNLKTRGDAEIDRRLASLQTVLTKLQETTKLNAADKTTLTQQVKDEMTGLGNLKAKLTADTALTDGRTDVQSIFTDYRVYALMLPKTAAVVALDSFGVVGDKLATLQSDLQNKVDAAKSAGTDVTSAQASLDDMKSKLADATKQTDGLTAKIIALTPNDYNTSHSALSQYRTNLKTARADFAAARQDASTVASALKIASPSPSTSPAAP